MAIRLAAASGLALAAALIVASPARAQLFRFFDVSPGQIVGMLEDDGYQVRGGLIRRGDVYICNAVSISGRSVRLIVSARDGHILERYAATPRWRDMDEDAPSPRRSREFNDDRDESRSRRDLALGDLFTPPSRVYGNDSLSVARPTPPADVGPSKPKARVVKKRKEPAIAKAAPAPEPTPAAEAPKPDGAPSVAAVAPNPAPEPKKPAVEPARPAAPSEGPRIIEINRPAAETKPAPAPAPTPSTTKAEVEKRAPEAAPAPAPVKPKPDVKPAKKLNDLPVGTLD